MLTCDIVGIIDARISRRVETTISAKSLVSVIVLSRISRRVETT